MIYRDKLLILRIRMEHHLVSDRVSFFPALGENATRQLESELRRIVAEEVAKEREACARIADYYAATALELGYAGGDAVAARIADTIQGRGKQ